jgi:uncharacterized membrane protein YqjE
MSDSTRTPLFSPLRDELKGLSAELLEAISLRRQLATIELQNDLRASAWLLATIVAAVLVLLVGFSILAVSVSLWLDAVYPIEPVSWTGVFGAGFVLFALMTLLFGWKRFQSRFTALEQTREELREDVVWLNEWLGRETPSGDDD